MNEKNYTFRDARLRSLPLRLLNAAGAGAALLGLRAPSLKPDAIVAAALARTGLRDTGDSSFREPLERYAAAADGEAELNTLGRIAVRNMLVNALCNRLHVIDWLQRHPQVSGERITQPWVVIGLPRTGTSLLCSLLGLDPGCRPLLQWEAAQPIPPADLTAAAEDPRIAVFGKNVERMLRLNPAVGAMHPFGGTLAEECTALFMYSLRTIGMESIAFVPSYGEWLANADMAPTYALHKMALQAFQHAQPTERWVLKSPQHLWHLQALLDAYPDARVVWIHRDPAAVVTSLASLNNAMQLPFARRHDPVRVAEYWSAKIVDGIAKASAFDAARGDGWCYHVHYDDLLADPAASLEKIYRRFGDTLSSLQRRRITAWLQYRPQNAFGRHVYDPRDFGWTRQSLQARYLDYRQRYGIPGSA
jgi:hypothetical protein